MREVQTSKKLQMSASRTARRVRDLVRKNVASKLLLTKDTKKRVGVSSGAVELINDLVESRQVRLCKAGKLIAANRAPRDRKGNLKVADYVVPPRADDYTLALTLEKFGAAPVF